MGTLPTLIPFKNEMVTLYLCIQADVDEISNGLQ